MNNRVINLYHNMRLELIRLCPDCKSPVDELDAGSYCEAHQEFQELDDAMINSWLNK